MTEAESHLLTVLVTEYLTREAPDTAGAFQCLLNSPSPVTSSSFRLEDAVQHYSRTAPSEGNQLGLKDGHARRKMRKRKKVARPSSGEEKVLKVDQFILSRVSYLSIDHYISRGCYSGQI